MADLPACGRLPAALAAVASPLAKATIRLALIATALAGIAGARAVHAQETAPRPSWGDVGVGVSPLFRVSRYVESCCTPLSGWVTWGTGKFRLHTDYVHNPRRYRYYRDYNEERLGQEIVVERAYLTTDVDQTVGVALDWRWSEHTRVSPYLLLGLSYWNLATGVPCVARGEPVVRRPAPPHDPDELLYRVDFAEGEEQECRSRDQIYQYISPQLGLGVDSPIGARVFVRAQARLTLYLATEFRIGVGLHF